ELSTCRAVACGWEVRGGIRCPSCCGGDIRCSCCVPGLGEAMMSPEIRKATAARTTKSRLLFAVRGCGIETSTPGALTPATIQQDNARNPAKPHVRLAGF